MIFDGYHGIKVVKNGFDKNKLKAPFIKYNKIVFNNMTSNFIDFFIAKLCFMIFFFLTF